MFRRTGILTAIAAAIFSAGSIDAYAGVSAAEAAKLKSTLTPLGGQREGNSDGSIPAWNGGFTTAIPVDKASGRRGDPFKDEKPKLSITDKNVDQYAERLTDGVKAMLKKHPGSFRVDVYPTHRTAAAPQWVYDNTFKNATRAKMQGEVLEGAYGGVPFPIPATGAEVMWNHILRWRGASIEMNTKQYQLTTDGRAVLATDLATKIQLPYYYQDGSLEQFSKTNIFWTVYITSVAPAIKAGETLVGHLNMDPDKDQGWIYLTGQRRVRKLPNICCDAPAQTMAGLASYDEIEGYAGRLDRFDWKLIGKREMYVPYNGGNKLTQVKSDKDVFSGTFINPDHFRWELHRVWVVEATVRQGQRHQAPRSRYYCDEDTWNCVLVDRWDAKGQLWKTWWTQSLVAPDFPGTLLSHYGFNDLLSGVGFVGGLANEKQRQFEAVPRYPEITFSPDAMTGENLR